MRKDQMIRSMYSRGAAALGAFAISLGLISAVGCGSGSAPAKAFVTIVPGPTQVGVGGSLQIFAEATPSSVTWTLTPGTGCSGSGCGTLTDVAAASVTYVSPSTLAGSSATFTVTATSIADPSLSSTVTYTIFPVAVQITGPATSVVQPLTSAGFTAAVAGDPTTNGVTWSVSGANCSGNGLAYTNCGTLTNVTTSSVTYNAPAAPVQETILLTATSVQFGNATQSYAITVPKLNIFLYTPSTLPAAVAGEPYTATVQLTGNTPPYTFTATNLPSWATLTPAPPASGTSFTISGTPPVGTQGASFILINIADSGSPQASASKDFTLAVYPAAATGNNLLNGSYAFYASGWLDTTGTGSNSDTAYNGLAYIGSFTADGNGNITDGELDVNNFQTGLTSYSTLSGNYNIQYATAANGSLLAGFQTGYITLLPPGNVKPITLAVTFRGIQHTAGLPISTDVAKFGDFIEFDDTTGIGVPVTANSSGQRVSGTLALQQPSAALSQAASPFNGSFAFGMNGNTSAASTTPPTGTTNYDVCFETAPPSCGPVSLAGVFDIASNGVISNGEEDVMVASNYFAASANSLNGTVAGGGATDASGRMTASIVDSQKYAVTVSSTSVTTAWPSDFIMYAIDSEHFYFMSSDNYQNYATIIGTSTMQQPTVTTGSAPLSATNPMALISTTTSTQYFTNGSGPNGKVRDQIQVFQPVLGASGCTSTQYGLSGPQYQDLSGTITTAAVGSVGNYCNTLSANGRLQPAANSTGEGEPIIYLYDTNTGYGTQWNTGSGPGMWMVLNRTSSSLNAGNYSGALANATSIVGPLEVMELTLPKGVPTGTTAAGAVPFTGTDFSQFSSVAGEYTSSGGVTFTGPVTGTMANNTSSTVNGVTYTGIFPQKFGTAGNPAIIFNQQNEYQGCIDGFGFVISPTSFVCFSTVDEFPTAHLFQQ